VRGRLTLRRGDTGTALALHREALRIRQAIGNRWGVALAIEGVAAALAEARPDDAARLFAAALEAFASKSAERLGPDFQPACGEGTAMSEADACSLALGDPWPVPSNSGVDPVPPCS
jgi:hypothetical protein